MGFFRRKEAAIPKADINGPWSVAEGDYNGKPLIVRVNEGLKSLIGHPKYKHQVGIAVPLHSPNESGLPAGMELMELDKIEDLLCAQLEVKGESLIAAVITTNGMREFVFYTSSPSDVEQKFKNLQQDIESHKIQLMIQ